MRRPSASFEGVVMSDKLRLARRCNHTLAKNFCLHKDLDDSLKEKVWFS